MPAEASLDDLVTLSRSRAAGEAEAAVVITTKDRRELAADAVASALAQRPPVEVVVVDDASSDGTAEHLAGRFGDDVTLLRARRSAGYILRRNQAAVAAAAPIVVSIDDDALFSSPDVVATTLADFAHARVGAVAIPYVNINQDDVLRQRAPGDGIWVIDSYIGTAHAVRRPLFLRLGGYRPQLVHQGEERDLCIRLLEQGYVVRLGRAQPVHHLESPRRDLSRMDHFGRRNDVLFAWHNVPQPYLVPHLVMTTLRGLAFGLRVGRPGRMARGLVAGFRALPAERRERVPVSRRAYRLNRRLRRRAPAQLSALGAALPGLPEGAQA